MKTVFMFPGQGAQAVGMGKALADEHQSIRDLYDQANTIVDMDLASVCFDGPDDKLNSTIMSQPAIFLTSAAILTAIRQGLIESDLQDVTPDYCAGLSLGEYTALWAAGAMNFEDGLKLVKLRGESMQAAADASAGSMVSILGLDEAAAEKLCDAVRNDSGEMIAAVNFNCPGQIVVSGTIKACQIAAEKAEQFGASRAIPLTVAGAFHTDMMAPAAEKLGQALEQVSFADPAVPVVANVDAKRYPDAAGHTDAAAETVGQCRTLAAKRRMAAGSGRRAIRGDRTGTGIDRPGEKDRTGTQNQGGNRNV